MNKLFKTTVPQVLCINWNNNVHLKECREHIHIWDVWGIKKSPYLRVDCMDGASINTLFATYHILVCPWPNHENCCFKDRKEQTRKHHHSTEQLCFLWNQRPKTDDFPSNTKKSLEALQQSGQYQCHDGGFYKRVDTFKMNCMRRWVWRRIQNVFIAQEKPT